MDYEKDGKYDELCLEIKLPLNPDEYITQVDLMLFFDYRLKVFRENSFAYR